jgi:hypothetical protein
MCLEEKCICGYLLTHLCYDRFVFHITERKRFTCYKCLGLSERPKSVRIKKKSSHQLYLESRKFDLQGKCALCGGFGYVIEKSTEEFSNNRDLLLMSQKKFMFCESKQSCIQLFQKYLFHSSINPCLITPYVFKYPN